ncbi:DUF1648 domain-containing protein [Thermoanaerobacterium thermosaccharolyticum]|uniref:DUF1648 domain-containing protein n=1 Tax=Thermoanaerobacterium thermosaccharolyticum TaxID=1517 RepID=UPI00177CD60A|nr:DUF1648 domain-containing protein [Thermoanaerobacterium thermosaccharolyticum]MBE0068933.1 DUF1648 domain-containing protein [Thermoanaerobacterium thermosaccharolyticum]MBE0228768.1 DUF1648 domain-containing protein [Thermoanaerobacterium thermosaccharolyticum]
MLNKRPKIQIPMTPMDIIVELLSILVTVSIVIITIILWYKLPGTIPTHFNIRGEVNSSGSKSNTLILLSVIILMYVMFTVLTRYPHIFNYLVEITEENAIIQYKLAKSFMRFLKLEIVLLLSYIEYITVNAASSSKISLGLVFLPISIIAIFVTLGIYIYKSVKVN